MYAVTITSVDMKNLGCWLALTAQAPVKTRMPIRKVARPPQSVRRAALSVVKVVPPTLCRARSLLGRWQPGFAEVTRSADVGYAAVQDWLICGELYLGHVVEELVQ